MSKKHLNTPRVKTENTFNSSESKQLYINFIKEEVASGTYQIYSEKIAAKLMEYVKQKLPSPEMA